MDGGFISSAAVGDLNRRHRRVAVLLGGWSNERPVSLVTGRAVADGLRRKGYDVVEIDAPRDPAHLIAALEPRPDAVFNALHGAGGEDGIVQALLDLLRLPYTHSGVRASALAMDKPAAKRLFAAAGLPCPTGLTVPLARLADGDPLPRPYVVKPPRDGSSNGVRILRAGDNMPPPSAADWDFGAEALVERYIPGRELTVAVIETADGPRALGVTEIRPHAGFYDYTAKYTEDHAVHLVPAPIDASAYAEAMRIAVEAHRVLGCRGVSRADLRYDDTDGEPGQLHLLEVNTQPGMTPLSLVPEQAAACGVAFDDLVSWMVEHARHDG
jgi:D-alanine-D-alanine ligase